MLFFVTKHSKIRSALPVNNYVCACVNIVLAYVCPVHLCLFSAAAAGKETARDKSQSKPKVSLLYIQCTKDQRVSSYLLLRNEHMQ